MRFGAAPRPGRMFPFFPFLEREADAQLDCARRTRQRAYPHEVCAREARVRIGPLRMVQRVLRFDTEFQAAGSDRDHAEERRVEVPVRRPAESIASAVAPRV